MAVSVSRAGRPTPGTRSAPTTKIIAAQTVEKRVLAGIKTHLLSPEAIASAVQIFHQEQDVRRHQVLAQRSPAEREPIEIGRKLERAQDDIYGGDDHHGRTQGADGSLAERRTELPTFVATSPDSVVVQLHPGAAEGYRRLAENLHLAIERDDADDLRTELRKVIYYVDFIPDDGLGKFGLKVHASRQGFWPSTGKPRTPKTPQPMAAGFSSVLTGVRYGWVRE